MPICKTCQGEYSHQECVCPACGANLGRSGNLCHHCGAELTGKRLCPRCLSDVSVWEREYLPFREFLLRRKGWVGLLPSLAVLFAAFYVWPQRSDIHHWLATLVAIGVSAVIFRVLYIKRFYWRERLLASQIYNVKAFPLLSVVAGVLVIGLAAFVVAYVLYQWRGETPNFLDKMFFAVFYALAVWGLTAGLTLLAIQSYLERLNERVPLPVYMHTDRLLDVVLRTVIPTLEDRAKLRVRQGPPDVQQALTLEVLKVERLAKDGGIQVLLREGRVSWRSDGNGDFKPTAVERVWNIEADCWGRVRSLRQESIEPIVRGVSPY